MASKALLTVPTSIRRDESVVVQLVIQHPMEPGFRRDAFGTVIPLNIIEHLIWTLNGKPLLTMDISSGMSANPHFAVPLRFSEGGLLRITWQDTAGMAGSVETLVKLR